jgi:plasmid stabilization system protein ParE
MTKPVRFDTEAEEELAAAAVRYEEQQAGLARELLSAVNRAVERIRSGPGRCTFEPTVPRELNVQRAFVQKFWYRLVFVELADEVRVLAVVHHRQRPDHWRHRVSDQAR